jgi:hypothetical protein
MGPIIIHLVRGCGLVDKQEEEEEEEEGLPPQKEKKAKKLPKHEKKGRSAIAGKVGCFPSARVECVR